MPCNSGKVGSEVILEGGDSEFPRNVKCPLACILKSRIEGHILQKRPNLIEFKSLGDREGPLVTVNYLMHTSILVNSRVVNNPLAKPREQGT